MISLKNCISVTSGYANSSSSFCLVRTLSLRLALPSAHSSHGLAEGSDSTYPIALSAAVIPCPVDTPICLNGMLVTSPTARIPRKEVSPSSPTVISPNLLVSTESVKDRELTAAPMLGNTPSTLSTHCLPVLRSFSRIPVTLAEPMTSSTSAFLMSLTLGRFDYFFLVLPGPLTDYVPKSAIGA